MTKYHWMSEVRLTRLLSIACWNLYARQKDPDTGGSRIILNGVMAAWRAAIATLDERVETQCTSSGAANAAIFTSDGINPTVTPLPVFFTQNFNTRHQLNSLSLFSFDNPSCFFLLSEEIPPLWNAITREELRGQDIKEECKTKSPF